MKKPIRMRNILAILTCFALSGTGSTKISQSFLKGMEAWNNNNHKAALSWFSKVEGADSIMAISHFYRGRCYFHLNQVHRAKKEFTKAIRLNPEYTEAYLHRGHCNKIQNKLRLAIDDYNLVLKQRSNDMTALEERGRIKIQMEDYIGAIEDFLMILEQRPKYPVAYNNLGVAKFYRKDFYGAINAFSKAISLDNDYCEAYYHRGMAHKEMENFPPAISDLDRTINICPGFKNATELLSNVFDIMNQNKNFMDNVISKFKTLGYIPNFPRLITNRMKKKAIKKFQWDKGLPLTGYIDYTTYVKLFLERDGIITLYNNQFISSEPSWHLDAKIEAGTKISKVEVKPAGKKIQFKNESKPNFNANHTAASIDWHLPLIPGDNTYVLKVFSIKNEVIGRKSITIRYAPQKKQIKGSKYAVVISVQDYDDPNIIDLKYSTNDAEAVVEALIHKMGFKSENIILLADKTKRKIRGIKRILPTDNNIRRQLFSEMRKKHLSKDDALFFYWSGHGIMYPSLDGVPENYLAPKNFDSEAVEVNGFKLAELNELNNLPPERKYFILDCCYAVPKKRRSNNKSVFLPNTPTFKGAPTGLQIYFHGKGTAALFSSKADQLSQESERLKHGLFTYYFLEIVNQGEKDVNKVYKYVHKKVTEASNNIQTPCSKINTDGVLYFPS